MAASGLLTFAFPLCYPTSDYERTKNNFDVLGLISSAFSFEVHKVHTSLINLVGLYWHTICTEYSAHGSPEKSEQTSLP